jgi:hypothetical protein
MTAIVVGAADSGTPGGAAAAGAAIDAMSTPAAAAVMQSFRYRT